MNGVAARVLTRLLPVLLAVIVYAAWMADIQQNGPWLRRNLLPMAACMLLFTLSLYRNDGRLCGPDPRLILGTVGFAIPSIGLSAYLHYAYAVNLNDLFALSSRPEALFRYLPIYTSTAGLIGFAIGWIVGRNIRE